MIIRVWYEIDSFPSFFQQYLQSTIYNQSVFLVPTKLSVSIVMVFPRRGGNTTRYGHFMT